ncbi:Uncharacterised protein [Vibrio cholerae]|nr:Uncharacterised protein [Vibrio cholerae]
MFHRAAQHHFPIIPAPHAQYFPLCWWILAQAVHRFVGMTALIVGDVAQNTHAFALLQTPSDRE